MQNQQMQNKQQSGTPDKYGLLGLLSVIRMTDPDLNTLALGTDLTTLGLNLNSTESLYVNFTSPFAENNNVRREPEFYIPMCYIQSPLQPATQKMTLFSDETLFYIFYTMPRDILQVAAAAELYKREWRYLKEHKLWITRDTEKANNSFVLFDINNWEKRNQILNLVFENLDSNPPNMQ